MLASFVTVADTQWSVRAEPQYAGGVVSGTNLFAELKRRNVLRAATFYAAAAWLLVQVATQVFPFFHIPEWVVRWIVIAAVVGFPFALAASWFYEWTPHGFVRESDARPSSSLPPRSGKVFDRWIVAILVVAVVLLISDKVVSRRNASDSIEPMASDKSVAVLPMVNESGDVTQDYFSDGLSEDLIAALAQVRDLKVIGRSSSFQFRGKEQNDSAAIGLKLGVATLLEGTVRKQGDHVRIVASLIHAADGTQLWSQSYDRQLADVFAMQSDIATSVATALKTTLLGTNSNLDDRPPSGRADAFNALLQGNFYSERLSPDELLKAIHYYDDAIGLDTRYAFAYAKRSFARTVLAAQNLGGQQATAIYALAQVDARTALDLDANLAFAHIALGSVVMSRDFDLTVAEAEFRRAVALAPQDATAKNILAALAATVGRLDEAIELTERALTIEPLHSSWYRNLAQYLIPLGRLDESERAIRHAIELQPTAPANHMVLTIIDLQRGHVDAALQAATQEPSDIWSQYALALAHWAKGDRTKADSALQRLSTEHADDAQFQIASAYAFRKQPDESFVWLERARLAHDPGLTGLLRDPFLLRYKDDQRFAAICKEVGIPQPE
jgi:TolB-like protein/Flp pilus assembly protein TadD